jgi:transcriptional regulator with GAF, ATPase, and Fis domain
VWYHFHAVDDAEARRSVALALARAGVDLEPLDERIRRGPGIVIAACASPGLFEYLRDASRAGRERVLLLLLADDAPQAEAMWRLLRDGASDVLSWRSDGSQATTVAARLERWAHVESFLGSPQVRAQLVGSSPPWLSALRQAVEAAAFTDAPLLIEGETGTGKELVARLIHTLDPRPRKRDFVVLDCTTIVPELAGSEFFGHERGAFTGAIAARDGAFGRADGGTLLLDEVGELPLALQAELLRVVQEHSYKRVGSDTWRVTSFRLVCATHRDLPSDVEHGTFRRDLYYRIAAIRCLLPPLSERTEDIIPLVEHFAATLQPNGSLIQLDDAVREYLLRRAYPGNVRDLRQLVVRMMHRHVGPGPLTPGDVPENERPTAGGQHAEDWRDETFRRAIQRAVTQGVGLRDIGRAATETAVELTVHEEGSLTGAARRLGVTDRALQMRRASRRRQILTQEGPG